MRQAVASKVEGSAELTRLWRRDVFLPGRPGQGPAADVGNQPLRTQEVGGSRCPED